MLSSYYIFVNIFNYVFKNDATGLAYLCPHLPKRVLGRFTSFDWSIFIIFLIRYLDIIITGCNYFAGVSTATLEAVRAELKAAREAGAALERAVAAAGAAMEDARQVAFDN